MPLISNFPEQNRLIAQPTIDIKSLPQRIRNYYKNIIQFIDECIYFSYLKNTDPLYGLNFRTQLPHYIRVNLGLSIPLVIYSRKYPDDEEVDPFKFSIIEEQVALGNYSI